MDFVSADGKNNADPYAIQAAIKRLFGSAARLATLKGVKPSTIQAAVYRKQPTGNRIIAGALGVPVHRIWPQWFDKDGNTITQVQTEGSRNDGCAMHQKGAAA
jgi:lambda repressor-like predicted transcriptional regulator